MTKQKHNLKNIVTTVWVINLAVAVVVGTAAFFYWISGAGSSPAQFLILQSANIFPTHENASTSTPVAAATLRTDFDPEEFLTLPTIAPTSASQTSGLYVTIRTIGHSVEGRPLDVHVFGTGEKKRMIVGGIHGGYEWNTIALSNLLINHIMSHPEIIPADVTLYILPNLNPDGEARSHDVDGRANANNVDLNHNWPYNWKEDWSRTGCFNLRMLNGGSGPASEPETFYLLSFLNIYKPQAMISYHSAALGIFAGGIPPTPPSFSLAEAVSAVSDYPWPPVDTGCDYSGNLTDWAAYQGIAAIDIELSTHKATDFETNLRVLDVLLNWEYKP